jgi:hypothetical protein
VEILDHDHDRPPLALLEEEAGDAVVRLAFQLVGRQLAELVDRHREQLVSTDRAGAVRLFPSASTIGPPTGAGSDGKTY